MKLSNKGYPVSGTDTFLNQMLWKVNEGKIKDIFSLQIDVFRFRFCPALDKDTAYDMIDFMKTLDKRSVSFVIKLFVWLKQKQVYFTMKFGWNSKLSLRYNLKNLKRPRQLMEQVLACDDLMTCDVCALEEKKGAG